MHELAITEAVIDLINREAREKGFSKVLSISLRVGEYSGIIPECIREFFPIAARDSIAREAQLEIRRGGGQKGSLLPPVQEPGAAHELRPGILC